MHNDLGLKLVAVVDLNRLRLYEARGVKILKKLEQLSLALHKEHRHEQGSYRNFSGPSSAFEPHTSEKDLEHSKTAKIINQHLEKVVEQHNDYKEVVIAAEPKMLGHIRQHLSPNLKKLVTKEIAKDFVHQDMSAIEHSIFS